MAGGTQEPTQSGEGDGHDYKVLGPSSHPYPAKAGLPAEFMASGCAEVIVWPEGLIECGNQIEEGLATALVTQRAFILATLALAQSEQR